MQELLRSSCSLSCWQSGSGHSWTPGARRDGEQARLSASQFRRGAQEERDSVCAQVVPNSSAFLIIPAHSSARGRRKPRVPHQTVTRTYADRGIGLKILVSAVQSRPCPPCFSVGCPPRNSPSAEFVPRFVPTSGTLQRIPAHECVCESGVLAWQSLPGEARDCELRPEAWVGISPRT